MKSVLFVVRSFSRGGPQPIRFQQITNYLKRDFKIHVLELHYDDDDIISCDGLTINRIAYSRIGRILNPIQKNSEEKNHYKNTLFTNSKAKLKTIIRKSFFPDTLIFEKSQLLKKVCELQNIYSFQAIVASGFPFTTMMLAKTVKKKYPTVKFIYDIGDPFYKNSKNGIIRDIRAKNYEKKYLSKIDILVVTNIETAHHYLKHYQKLISQDQIVIIEQGVSSEKISKLEISKAKGYHKYRGDVFTFVYAGQLYAKLREPFNLYKAIYKWNSDLLKKKIHLDMYGNYNEIFKNVLRGDQCIHFKGKINNEDVLKAYLNCDIIIFLDNAYGMQVPGKVFEIATIGKPILFISDHPKSPTFEIVKSLKHIVKCKNSPDSIIAGIESINMKVDKDQIRRLRKDFSWKRRAEQFSQIIDV